MTEKKRRWLLIFGVLVPVALVLAIGLPAIVLSFQKLPPLPPLPNPNGYAELVQAGGMIAPDTAKFEKMSAAELQKLAAANAPAIALAQLGLSHSSRVTTQFTPNYLNLNGHFIELSALKGLAEAMLAEGKLAELKNHPSNAAKFYLATFALGNESARGGILIDQLVGSAGERTAVYALEKITGKLDAKSCRETAATLETLDAQRQTWPEVMQQEQLWAVRTYNSFTDKIRRQLTAKAVEKVFEKPAQNFAEQQTRTRQVTIQFAMRAFELEKGRRPATLGELVPVYLKAIPQDPLTGASLVYSPR